MTYRLAPRAIAEAKRKKGWWQRHRPKAPDLFDQELNAAIERIVATPDMGVLYEQTAIAASVRRVLMRKTQNHVYYYVQGDEVLVVSVWGARQGRGPKL
jgi:plasmid stabilization system protein ParE